MLNRYSFAVAALLAAGAVLHLVPAIGGDGRFIGEWFDIGHVLGFAALAYLLVRVLETAPGRKPASPYAYAGAAAIAIAVGVAAEGAQLVARATRAGAIFSAMRPASRWRARGMRGLRWGRRAPERPRRPPFIWMSCAWSDRRV